MRALRRLEQGGYRLALAGDRITFSYHGAEPLPRTWAEPLLAELRPQREAVRAVLQARLDWLAVFDEWAGRPSTDSPDDDAYLARLAELAIAGLLPNYEDGATDAGAAGWLRLAQAAVVHPDPTKEVMPMTGERPRPLPW